MHYNQFTIDYIEAVKRNLKIHVDDLGLASFFPEDVSNENIASLKLDIQSIWGGAEKSIEIVKTRHDAKIQSGLFGSVNDLDEALKVGFLLGDRVVLLDYLFERILLKKEPGKIDKTLLGMISTFLVSLFPLAKIGRVVIIPNPLNWNLSTKKVMMEVSTKTTLTPNLMSMLNMLSITKSCQLHPYTIAESEQVYKSIINRQINNTSAIGFDACTYAYEGILAGLLSEKLINKAEFKSILDTPINHYYEIVSKYDDFHLNFLERITSGGSLSSENNISKLVNDVSIKNNNNNIYDYTKIAKPLSTTMAIGGNAIAVASSISLVSAPLGITGALMGLSATLAGLFSSNTGDDDTIISLFNRFYRN